MQRIVRHCLIALVAVCLTPLAHAEGKKKIVLIAGTPSHEFGGHEHNAGVLLLGKCLMESPLGDRLDIVVLNAKPSPTGKFVSGWPKDTAVLQGAAAIVIYCDGGNNHMILPHLAELDELAKKGVGIGMIHYAVEPGEKVDPDGHAEFLRWIGGYFEAFFSVNPHWKAHVTAIPDHPVGRGVKPFSTNDEWYYHMRFRPNMEGVTPIIAAIPPDSSRVDKNDAHNGNPTVHAGIGKSLVEYMVWVSENKETGNRGFGCTGAHVHWNWGQDDFRKTILNSIVWIAKLDVPANGVESRRPTVQELLANMDPGKKRKPEQTDEWIAKFVEDLNAPRPASPAASK